MCYSIAQNDATFSISPFFPEIHDDFPYFFPGIRMILGLFVWGVKPVASRYFDFRGGGSYSLTIVVTEDLRRVTLDMHR